MDEGIDLCGGWIVRVVGCVVLEIAGGELKGDGRDSALRLVCGLVIAPSVDSDYCILYVGQKIAGAFAKRPPRQGVTLPGHGESKDGQLSLLGHETLGFKESFKHCVSCPKNIIHRLLLPILCKNNTEQQDEY